VRNRAKENSIAGGRRKEGKKAKKNPIVLRRVKEGSTSKGGPMKKRRGKKTPGKDDWAFLGGGGKSRVYRAWGMSKSTERPRTKGERGSVHICDVNLGNNYGSVPRKKAGGRRVWKEKKGTGEAQ